ncbi:uncharacterized protein DSM5745_06001 [Aspergillus mulundensis]|uniref:Uncharacterized protein n=1 Tax=Aspergillus mulundensis TaxID=1810919 RepID=A0A3D8RYL8_9EURO|nr:hypothetical protein DSM5745_06001 [Aspergillus mulundensis]RDW79149.1 hypothetical protein DSM5745_06001 [Aspergillus mulundensis]
MTTLRHEDYTVGWICALSLGMAAAKAMLDEIHEDLPVKPNDHNAYTLGRIGKHNVAIACLPSGEYGIASAATVATQLLSSFQSVKFGLLVGIGGGIPSRDADIRLGDVVVGLPTSSTTHGGVIQYDLGKATHAGKFVRTGALNRPPQILLTAVSKLQAIHQMEGSKISKFVGEISKKYPMMRWSYTDRHGVDSLFEASYQHEELRSSCINCDSSQRVKRPIRTSQEPVIHYGLIASGNQVVRDGHVRDHLGRQHGALCVEMEAAGLVNDYPCLVIRGICDYADSHKNKTWQRYTAAVAAAYAKELLLVTSDHSVEDNGQAMKAKFVRYTGSGRVSTAYPEVRKRVNWLRSLHPSRVEVPRIIQASPSETTWCQMFNNRDYGRWYYGRQVDTHKGLIWIKGKPGSGKSTFMKHAFCRALDELQEEGAVVAAFSFNAQDKNKVDLFGSLLHQLLQANESDLHTFMKAFDDKLENIGSDAKWSEEELWSYLKAMFTVQRRSRTLFFVDGLDECESGGMRELALLFREMTTAAHAVDAKLSICLFSREYPKVSVESCPEIMIDRLNGIDIRRYVEQKFNIVGVGKHQEWRKLAAAIVDKSSGVFLWVVLVVDTVLKDHDDGKNLKYLERRLRETPLALEKLFEQLLITVDSHDLDLTKKLFSWVVYAVKPLRLLEWHHILAWIRDEPPKSLKEWRKSSDYTETAWQLERQLQRISRGLVGINAQETESALDDRNSMCGDAGSLNSQEGETRTVQVIHGSVREFFLSGRGFEVLNRSGSCTSGSGDISILETCLSYIRISELDALVSQREEVGNTRLMGKRTRSEASFGSSASNYTEQYRLPNDDRPSSPVQSLFPSGHMEEAALPDEGGESSVPLRSFALEQYLQDSVSAIDPDAAARAAADLDSLHSETAGSQTLEDHPALLSYALDAFLLHATCADKRGVSPNYMLDQLRSGNIWHRWLHLADTLPLNTRLLYFAVDHDLISWVKYLLSTGSIPNDPGGANRYPLNAAIAKGHLEVMKLLLEYGARPNVADSDHNQPLHHIAKQGQTELLSGFLHLLHSSGDTTVDRLVNRRGQFNETPLHVAVKNGHVSMTEQLLACGSDPNRVDTFHKTALYHACESGQPNLIICKLLLASGARATISSESNLYPSQVAFQKGFLAGVSLLNDYLVPDAEPLSDLLSKMTVQVVEATGIDLMKRPYILTSFDEERKILYPTENSPAGRSEWNKVHFLVSDSSVGRLYLHLLDLQYPETRDLWVYAASWRVRYVTSEGKHIAEHKQCYTHNARFGHRSYIAPWRLRSVSVTLEVIVPLILENRARDGMLVRDIRL